jgi:sugar phosphate isomerase/epimerase
MLPAVFSRTYSVPGIAAVLASIVADGFRAAQMNLASFGMESLPAALDAPALDRGREAAARLGLSMVALSGTWNMAHPDPEYRAAMRPRFVQVLTAAQALGVPVVTLCTGSRDPADMWAHHPDNGSARAWADFRAELDLALDQALARGLTLAIEPEPGNVIRDARAARRLIDQVGAPHLKIILDAANLIGTGGLDRQGAIVAEALDLLGPQVILAHAKDIDAMGRVVAPGRGAIDLPGFVAALKASGFDGPLIGHGFPAEDSAVAGRALTALCAA